jgi:exopolysaccharide production protein ExoQ
MPRQIALSISIAVILWLFFRDHKLRPMTSVALWIPMFWIIIIGTRAVSVWFATATPEMNVNPEDGSSLDRTIDIILAAAGLVVLLKRRIKWGILLKDNIWFFAFFIFCGISCLWSDYTFISFKRYIKNVCHVIMVLIIITEINPAQAVRALLSRYTYVVVICSILFIKYFPEFGRYYNAFTYEVAYCGVTTQKNALGQISFICGMFMVWDLMKTLSSKNGAPSKLDLLTRGTLLAMVIWLLYMAHSSTAITCFILGTGILFFIKLPIGRSITRNIGMLSLVIIFLMIILYSFPELLTPFLALVGRDLTFTGRTDIWKILIAQPVNRLIGSGFESFWLTPLAEKAGEGYWFKLNQAHNGYLEMYLHIGLIGLTLFIAAVIAGVANLKRKLLLKDSYAILLFSFIIVILVNNWTEASFNKMALIWLIFILALFHYLMTDMTSDIDNTKSAI